MDLTLDSPSTTTPTTLWSFDALSAQPSDDTSERASGTADYPIEISDSEYDADDEDVDIYEIVKISSDDESDSDDDDDMAMMSGEEDVFTYDWRELSVARSSSKRGRSEVEAGGEYGVVRKSKRMKIV
jgi:hypothetical protein